MEVKPSIHIFGHVHASYGQEILDGTTYINASNIDYFEWFGERSGCHREWVIDKE